MDLRRGDSRALVDIQHTIIVAIWHVLADGEVFKELGPNYYDEHNKDRAKNRAVEELVRLGSRFIWTRPRWMSHAPLHS